MKKGVVVFPRPRPRFVFDDSGPNLNLASPALNLYLLAPVLKLYLPADFHKSKSNKRKSKVKSIVSN